MITVKDLIEVLKNLPEDAKIYREGGYDDNYEVGEIELVSNTSITFPVAGETSQKVEKMSVVLK